ncbi:cytochrome P450 6a2-like [Leptinotarsa decemlineata]|uniref:cytochrome P450 6a2-like n=1 Tax=Leptinotarsa decemlineata TaxID=7539 RepID=UPI003D3044F5
MGILSVEILGTFSMVMLICFSTIYLYFNISYQYWKRRGVPYLKPKFPTGNSSSLFRKTRVFPLATMDFYKEIKKRGWKFGGVYTVLRPVLVIVDPALMKNILLTDFQYFIDRGFYYNEKDDPISAHLFALDEKSWKNMRIKLTPTFTSGKMKMMFPAVVQKSRYMVDAIIKCAESNEDVDINEFLAKFTTDVIGDCALGMECNSFTNPQAEFRTAGRKLKKFNGILHLLQVTITSNSPDLALKLGFPAVEKDISDFFRMAVKKGVQYRKDNNVTRPDFFQLLINMMQETKNNDKPFTMDQLVAQVFLFFVAGFDTSSSTMNFALYELAQAPDIQDKLRNEINAVLKKHNDEITYENLKEMQYLQQVLDETMRKYPAVPVLQRKCVKDYKMRDSEIVIEKGTAVLIPIISLHMDPDYYPQPTKFDPERFTPEMKQARNPFLHIPFGEGPRNCIGLRFGMMQSKIGLIQILKNFKLSISPNTNMPLQLDRDAFLLKSVETLYLRAERI